jgi:glycosyltransferase involved in cell wall biosynthesis
VRSVLAQTFTDLEVIVVIDGPDIASQDALIKIDDPRLRVLGLERNVGGSDARNVGVQAARGMWVAFLDDDDEWLCNKLERQLAMLPSLGCTDPIISCRFIAHTDSGDYAWPKRFPRPLEPISEFLLVRDGIAGADGFVATPTILARRSLLSRVPFKSGLRKHQDWDWVLRATTHRGVSVFFCPEVLAVCRMQGNNSTSRDGDWRFSIDWIHRNRDLVTARAYSGFVTTHVGWQAAAQRNWAAFVPLLWDASRNGSPRMIDIMRYFGFWFLTPSARHWIKHRLEREGGRERTLAIQAK